MFYIPKVLILLVDTLEVEINWNNHCETCIDRSYPGVDEKEDEVFSVPKANAVVDPGAVVIHVQDTAIAGRTMVTSFWLEHIAYQAISLSLMFFISKVKPL